MGNFLPGTLLRVNSKQFNLYEYHFNNYRDIVHPDDVFMLVSVNKNNARLLTKFGLEWHHLPYFVSL